MAILEGGGEDAEVGERDLRVAQLQLLEECQPLALCLKARQWYGERALR